MYKMLSALLIITLTTAVVVASAQRDIIWLNETTANSQNVALDIEMPRYVASASFNGTAGGKKLLTFVASLSYSNEMPVGSLATKSMELAIDRLRSLPHWLPDYEVAISLIEEECSDPVMIERDLAEFRNTQGGINRVPIMIGASCVSLGTRTVAELSSIHVVPETFDDRHRFDTYYALGERFDIAHVALVDFMSRMGWRRVAIISETFTFYDQVESTLFPRLEAHNISITFFAKYSHVDVFPTEMEQAFEQLKEVDPRIILVDGDRGAGKACWLHRKGYYGPNYVIFFWYWAEVYPEVAVPENMMDWCTVEMMYEVLESAFIFGDSTLVETFGEKNVYDSTGLRADTYEAILSQKVNNPQSSPFWGYFRYFYYDLVLFTGLVLNATETSLRMKNQSLIDWVVGSENFEQNGRFLINEFKDAIHSINVSGFKGEYCFDESTQVNTKGYTPITFSQYQRNKDSPTAKNGKFEVVALYKSNEPGSSKLKIFHDRLKWLTNDGGAPKDSSRVVMTEIPTLSTTVYSALVGLAITEIAIFLFALLLVKFSQRLRPTSVSALEAVDFFIISGNILMLGQILSLPKDTEAAEQLRRLCSLEVGFLILGFSLSIFGIFFKLDDIIARLQRKKTMFNSWLRFLAALWIAIQTALVLAFLLIKSSSVTVATNNAAAPAYLDPKDSSLTYQPYRKECKLSLAPLGNVNERGGFTALMIIVSSHVSLLLCIAFACYKLRFIKQQSNEAKMLTTCCYYTAVLAVGSAFLCLLLADYTIVVVSIANLFYAASTSVLCVFATKFTRREESAPKGNQTNNSKTLNSKNSQKDH